MPYCIIIRGPLGVGKTTIAKNVARRMRGRYISIDSILEKNNLDKIEDGKIPLKNFIKSNDIVIRKIKESNAPILDGNFYYKKQLRDLENRLNMPVMVFTLKAPLSVCIERGGKRKASYGEKETKSVYRLVSKFDYGTPVDANRKPAEVEKEILFHIKNLIIRDSHIRKVKP